jgi:hypothetical protein
MGMGLRPVILSIFKTLPASRRDEAPALQVNARKMY